nr:uncharacterized protein LOC126530443 [Dermacentor andersoni]
MGDGVVPLHCHSALYLDLALEEVNRRFEKLLSAEGVEEKLAQEIMSSFRSRFGALVYGNVVVDEQGPTGSLTLEQLLEEKLHEVAHLRATVPAEVRRKHERALAMTYGPPPDGKNSDEKD